MKQFLFGLCMTMILSPALAVDQADDSADIQDNRVMVDFPDGVRQSMLDLMRHHLSSLQEVQQALAESNFNRAAEIAEFRLGVSSVGPRNARQRAYMPPPMQYLGGEMHRASSRLALAAKEADMRKALEGLSEVTGICVGCHATFRAKRLE